jgi:hypothetical protein
MSHEKLLWPDGHPRYRIDKTKMRLCISFKCPHFSFGTCKYAHCILKKKNTPS